MSYWAPAIKTKLGDTWHLVGKGLRSGEPKARCNSTIRLDKTSIKAGTMIDGAVCCCGRCENIEWHDARKESK